MKRTVEIAVTDTDRHGRVTYVKRSIRLDDQNPFINPETSAVMVATPYSLADALAKASESSVIAGNRGENLESEIVSAMSGAAGQYFSDTLSVVEGEVVPKPRVSINPLPRPTT